MRGLAWCLSVLAGCSGEPPSQPTLSGGDGTDSADPTAADGGTGAEATGSENGSTGSTSNEPGVLYDVSIDTDGEADCGCGSQLDFSYVWIANSAESTVSKIHTQTLIEEGRYSTRADGNGNPSRTSVSLSGTAVAVANRNGGVTKVIADPSLCDPMRNGTPGLQTSSGPDDVLPWGEDDCVAWATDFDYTTQRPIAWGPGELDPATCEYEGEWLWTSGCNKFSEVDANVHRLDGDTGMVLESVVVEGFACYGNAGYGGAVDSEGNFWITHNNSPGQLARIDRMTLEATIWDAPLVAYGITVDDKDRPWVVCSSGQGDCSAARFDPATEAWGLVDNHLLKAQTGIVQGPDGRIWMNYHWFDDVYEAGIAPIDPETLQVGDPIPLPAQAKGIGVDLDGHIWSVPPQMNAAYRVDPATGDFVTVTGLNYPYTYSDMTGWALQNAACDPAG